MTLGVKESQRLEEDIQAYKEWLKVDNFVTENQFHCINYIEYYSKIKFNGHTKQEAHDYILRMMHCHVN